MPETILVAVPMPSEAVIKSFRVILDGIQFAELMAAQRAIVMYELDNKTGLVWETGTCKEDYRVGLTDVGKLVLAAKDNPSAAMKVIDAARKARKAWINRYNNEQAEPEMNGLIEALAELDKEGGKG